MNTPFAIEFPHPETRDLAIPRPIPSRGVSSPPYIDHWVLQLQGVAPDRIDDPDRLQATLNAVVDALDLTRVSEHSHHFVPGVSTVIILSESHLSAHTWPELGYVHVDIVTCVEKLTGSNLERVFREAFAPEAVHMVRLDYTNGR